jgi:hypothetical protein
MCAHSYVGGRVLGVCVLASGAMWAKALSTIDTRLPAAPCHPQADGDQAVKVLQKRCVPVLWAGARGRWGELDLQCDPCSLWTQL